MGDQPWSEVKDYIDNDPSYPARFQAYMGTSMSGGVTTNQVSLALATYIRSLTVGDSPEDQREAFLGSLSDAEMRGRGLFMNKGRCVGCHSGPNFTDNRLWTTGNLIDDPDADLGAANPKSHPNTAGRARFQGAFRTPTLRELVETSPYFHDGNAETLTQVVEFYNNGGVRADGQGFELFEEGHEIVAEHNNRKLGLTAGEVADLVAFLEALTGTSANNGPIGLNNKPKVIVIAPPDPPPGGMAMFETITIKVKDLVDLAEDIDPSMDWTLDVTVNSFPYDWSSGPVTPLPGGKGYKVELTVPISPSYTVVAKAADHHGLWSNTATTVIN